MSELNQFILLAEYNKLMNQRIFSSASQLPDEELKKNCSAFFGSILGTLNHIMVGDIVWLKRFSEHSSSRCSLLYISDIDKPKSLDSILFDDLESLKNEREKIDKVIIQWVRSLSDTDFSSYISYSSMGGKLFKKKCSSLICHLFLHQVHHRGQVTTLLSQAGISFGDTDLIEIIDEYDQ